MTDWTAQTQAGVERWLEAQRAWWDQVLGAAGTQASGGPGAGADAAGQAIEAWRQSAYRIVDAQAQMLLATLRAHQETEAQELARRWTDAHRALWKDWLAAAGSDPAPSADASPDQQEAGRRMIEALREAAEHLVRSQAEWAKAWSDAQGGAKPGPDDDRRET